jgi:hypothetical protein
MAVTSLMRPSVFIRFNAYMNLNIFNELVLLTPRADVSGTDVWSNRLGMLFSWNFLPKSWLYIALNDYREMNESGAVGPIYRIGAVKAKYLISF